jgi:DNA-binding transcriptional MerR regulator
MEERAVAEAEAGIEGGEASAGELTVDLTAIPADKLYFRIGEVARIVGVKPYVLRYWETEFSILKPDKSPSKHRLYRRRDVETLLRIKELLHHKRFTIEGARKVLKLGKQAEPSRGLPSDELRKLREIRDQLVDLRESLG